MAYSPPQFNLLAKLWLCKFPADGPADYADVPVQKYVRSRMSLDVTPPVTSEWWEAYIPPIQLRFPRYHLAFTGIAVLWTVTVAEVPQGSGAYYRTLWREIQHEGFVNEYALVVATQCNQFGESIPAPLEDFGVGIDADVCPTGSGPQQDLVFVEWDFDNSAADVIGAIARAADGANYYVALYGSSSGDFSLFVNVAGAYTPLASVTLSGTPSHDSQASIYLTLVGDSITARVVTETDDQTITATDSTFASGALWGMIASPATALNVSVFELLHATIVVVQDLFHDTPGTDLAAHTMNTGTGWSYPYSGVVWQIDASFNGANPVSSGTSPFLAPVLTAYP